MKDDFTEAERRAARGIYQAWLAGDLPRALRKLRTLNDEVYAAIPERQRIGRGITWVVQRLSALLAATCASDAEVKTLALALRTRLATDDMLIGVPVFLMGTYGKTHLAEVQAFLENVAASEDWVVREFSAAGLRMLIGPHRNVIQPWLKKLARARDPNLRRLVSEALRPVAANRWLNEQPEYSLEVLRLLFRESHPYPRTSVGNNLSDLSRRQPELILAVVQELRALDDEASDWIAYRACRNLVKKYPERVLDLLGVDEYHYKDRNIYREASETE